LFRGGQREQELPQPYRTNCHRSGWRKILLFPEQCRLGDAPPRLKFGHRCSPLPGYARSKWTDALGRELPVGPEGQKLTIASNQRGERLGDRTQSPSPQVVASVGLPVLWPRDEGRGGAPRIPRHSEPPIPGRTDISTQGQGSLMRAHTPKPTLATPDATRKRDKARGSDDPAESKPNLSKTDTTSTYSGERLVTSRV
jgi:hypothetical protein